MVGLKQFTQDTVSVSSFIVGEGCEMSITATELKMNLSKYLMKASEEDIYITQYGRIVAKLTNPYQDRVDAAKSLFGCISDDISLEEAREERRNSI